MLQIFLPLAWGEPNLRDWSARKISLAAGISMARKRFLADRGVNWTMTELRSESIPKRLRSASSEESGQRESDLLADLLGRLTGALSLEREDSAAEAEAARSSAAEIRRFAMRANSADSHGGLEQLADLLLGLADSVEKSERRWLRLSFDLHDGPHQQIAALRVQVAIFAKEAAELDRQLQALDAGLAETVHSFEAPPLDTAPFEHSLEQILFDFTDATGVPVSLTVKGDFDSLTRSQQIALLRILAEALANVAEHADASRVRVSVRRRGRRAFLAVRDNGHGFDAEKGLTRAAKQGRLGVVGMGQRARLLGGTLDVKSGPKGTTVSAALPAGEIQPATPNTPP